MKCLRQDCRNKGCLETTWCSCSRIGRSEFGCQGLMQGNRNREVENSAHRAGLEYWEAERLSSQTRCETCCTERFRLLSWPYFYPGSSDHWLNQDCSNQCPASWSGASDCHLLTSTDSCRPTVHLASTPETRTTAWRTRHRTRSGQYQTPPYQDRPWQVFPWLGRHQLISSPQSLLVPLFH